MHRGKTIFDLRLAHLVSDCQRPQPRRSVVHKGVIPEPTAKSSKRCDQATRILKAEGAVDVRVLILTTFDPDEYVYESLQAGASGFVLKDIPPHELLAAVRVVAKGEALLAPSITQRLIARFADRSARPAASRGSAQLTDREAEVLVLMAKGLSNSEIAEQLCLSPTTIKSHVAGVLAKLGLRDRVQAVVFAYEHDVVRPGSTV